MSDGTALVIIALLILAYAKIAGIRSEARRIADVLELADRRAGGHHDG